MRKIGIFWLLFFTFSHGEEKDSGVSTGAYYYPWYDTDGRHWSEGYDGKLTGEKPALGEYSSRSPSVIRQHAEWSRDLGIDHWICSWWGPHSWEDETLRDHIIPTFDRLEAEPPKFCILYESAGLLGLDPERGIEFETLGNTRDFTDHFAYLARNYFDHPRYLKLDGKPVVYLYLTRTFTGSYGTALLSIRKVAQAKGFSLFLVGDEVYWGAPDEERIRHFDAITSYNMHGPVQFAGMTDITSFLTDTEQVYERYREVAKDLGVGFIPGVLPGFDARGAGGDYYTIPRKRNPNAPEGSTLQAFREMAEWQLDPRLKTIAITSFNEWHEGTQLEPKEKPRVP